MKKRGVSLIVLIITVIVVIILAVTVILTLSKNNPIESAKEATFKEDVRAYQDELNMYIAREYQQTQGMRDWKITATKYEKDSSNEEYNKSVYKYLNSFKKKYENKLAIKEDKIAYVGNDEKEKEWLVNSGVYVAKQFTVRYVDGNGNDLLPQEEIAQLDIEYTFYPKTIDGYVPMQDEISGVTSENTSITFEYCQICNDLLFIGLDSSGNETSDESSIVAYTVGGIGNCNNPYIAIPSTYNNKSVTKMKSEAFKNNALLKYVIIPDSIDSVANRAFYGSTRLNKVKINTKIVGQQSFVGCSNIESVEIGNNVETISSAAFHSCGKLKDFKINSESITIGERIFYGSNLIDEIKINSGNNSYTIVDGALYTKDMKNLVLFPPNKQGKYTFPSGVEKLLNYSCNDIKLEEIENTEVIETTSYRTFYGSTRLNKVKINVKTIGQQAFVGCSNLESVEIGSNVETISSGAFQSCGKLKDFKINSESITIGERIFYGSNLIDEIKINANNNAYTVVDGVLYTKDMKNLVLFPPNKQGKYTFPSGVEKLLNYSCNDIKLEEIENTEVIETTSYRTFYGSTRLNKVKINVKTIGQQAFVGCSNLESVEIGSNVETISSGAFQSCGKLKDFKINSENITIGENIFAGSNLIDEIKINSNNRSYTVVDGALYTKDMKNLVLLPPNKQGKYTLPSGVKNILGSSCSNCKIEEFENTEEIETVGYRAFYGSTSLNKVKINAKTIGSQAFLSCSNLNSVELGSNLTSIVSMAFHSCSKLKSVQYDGTKDQWNAISKNGWNNNSSITKVICTDGEIQL